MSMEPHVAERPKEKRPVPPVTEKPIDTPGPEIVPDTVLEELLAAFSEPEAEAKSFDFDDPSICLLYTSPSPRDGLLSRMPSSA